LIRLLDGQFESVTSGVVLEANPLDDVQVVLSDRSVPETMRQQLVQSRVGQGLFRFNVLRLESACRVTGVKDPDFLIASHVKPWKVSDNSERLDGANGLMLAPHIDRLFDRGFISFSNDGSLLVSQKLPESVLKAWSITVPVIKKPLSPAQQVFMRYHCEHVFLG
jgi:predicted restriction endonuclease